MKTNILNVTNDFLMYYETAKELSYEEKVKAWKEIYEDKNRDIFDNVVKLAHIFYEDFKLEDRYEYAFQKYEEFYDKILRISGEIEGEILKISNKCQELFDIKNDEIDSLDFVAFTGLYMADGWNTIFNGKSTTFFAVENMPSKREDSNIFLAHEITHGFHTSLIEFSDKESLAESLFLEGFAVAASEYMYRGFDEVTYISVGANSKEGWFDKSIESFSCLKNDIKQNLDNNSYEYKSLYFGGESDRVPYKAGYVYGYHMIKDFLKEFSFSEMIRWDKERVIEEVRKYYERLI